MNSFSLFGGEGFVTKDISLSFEKKETNPTLQVKYDKMLAELDEYQRNAVTAPVQDNMQCVAGPGCLAGDTIIRLNRAKKSAKFTLRELFLKFNGSSGRYNSKWDLSIETRVRSFFGETIQLNNIKGVYYSGVKRTFRLILENGFFLDVTDDHRILTKRGWVPAKDLIDSDEVMIDVLTRHQKTSSGKFAPKRYYVNKLVGKYYANAVKDASKGSPRFRAPEHRLIIEAEMNNLSLEDFIAATHIPNNLALLPKDSHVHHIDENTRNNSRDNLQVFFSNREHARHHTQGYHGFKHGIPEYSKVKSFEFLKEQETFDIECEGPSNFVANGIVVHNSGKTRAIISRAIKLVVEDNVDPAKIVLITFTNKAAKELKERYSKFFEGVSDVEVTPHISTIHSFCLSQIRRIFGFSRTILSEYQSKKIFREVTQKIYQNHKWEKPEMSEVNRLLSFYENLVSTFNIFYIGLPLFDSKGNFQEFIPYSRMANIPGYDIFKKLPYVALGKKLHDRPLSGREDQEVYRDLSRSGVTLEVLSEIFKTFFEEKYKNNTLDFGDMSFQQMLLLGQHEKLRNKVWDRVEHIILDEGQDTEVIQFYSCLLSDKDSFSEFMKNS